MNQTLKDIGKRIRVIRTVRDMSQSELAIEAGTDKGRISKIENGASVVGILLFVDICRALKVNPNEILGSDYDDQN